MVEGGQKNRRPSWDVYFLELANAASSRATCDRGKSGCVIVRDKQVLATGYVGSPAGLPHCDDVGHLMKKVIQENGEISEHCLRTVHAEQNAICQAAKRGVSIEGATVYTRMTPCRTCAMLLINCGIEKVVCERKYQLAEESEQLLAEASIELVYKYDGQQEY
ncbi:MAG: cytidine/deoxycytidylate deaminase family protein [Dehalococcoidales bacterium]|nr:MAG: cytidine/deoxycytidylate deaminase family protein [Dehalococcoidales bacterium]